jgi:hypothetical protein
MDDAAAEGMARDGGELVEHAAPLLPPGGRRQDGPRVLLLRLSERMSARGNRYMRGWLGKAAVVAFQGEADTAGNQTWNLYVSTPAPRPSGDGQGGPCR